MFKILANWLRRASTQPAPPPSEQAVPEQANSPDSSPAQLVPYDENLLERSRTQWQFGDWHSLAQLQRETLQHHPDRARLALLAAAGHQQLGNPQAARQFVRLAQDWGCSKKLVSQILIAGVHNTLGRAAAIDGRQQRALLHFEQSVKIASPSGDLRLLSQARAREELANLGLPLLADSPTGSNSAPRLPALGSAMQGLAEQLQRQNTQLSEQLKKQNADLISVRKHLESAVKKEMLNATQQLEAFIGIQSFLQHGERLPGMHGWPVSPDFALYLIELLDSNDYDLVLEFGSGTSTVLMAKTLARIGRKTPDKAATVQVAFEHLEQYHAQTLAHLQSTGLADAVQLTLAPLQPYQTPNGNTYAYYSCHDKLAELAKALPDSGLKILMVVDGPPGSTGKHARYPALPATLAHFENGSIDILLDDYFRDDEKEVGELWKNALEAAGYKTKTEKMQLEKEALFISSHLKKN